MLFSKSSHFFSQKNIRIYLEILQFIHILYFFKLLFGGLEKKFFNFVENIPRTMNFQIVE